MGTLSGRAEASRDRTTGDSVLRSRLMGVVFSVVAALTYGTSMFLTRLGLRSKAVPPLRAVMVNLIAANLLLWSTFAVSLLFQSVTIMWNGIAYFILAGLSAPLVGRYLGFQSIQRLGAARGSSFQLSEMLFAAPLALIFFDQHLTVPTVLGIVIVMVGMILFINEIRTSEVRTIPVEPETAFDPGEAAVPEGSPAVPESAQTPKVENRTLMRRTMSYAGIGVMCGLMAGLFFAAGNLFRQAGVVAIPSAVLGSAIGTLTALVVAAAGVVRGRQVRACLNMGSRDATFFATSGIASSLGMLCLFWALDAGSPVAVVTAIKNIAPMVTFGLVAVFLSRHERITVRLGLLVVLVVFGAGLTTIGRML